MEKEVSSINQSNFYGESQSHEVPLAPHENPTKATAGWITRTNRRSQVAQCHPRANAEDRKEHTKDPHPDWGH